MNDLSPWKRLLELAAALDEVPDQDLTRELLVFVDTAEALFERHQPEDDFQSYALCRSVRALRRAMSRQLHIERAERGA